MFNNILIGTDGSEHSLKAARAAGELARTLGSRVTIAHVIRPASPALGIPGLGVAVIDLTSVEEHYWDVAQAILDMTEKVVEEVIGTKPDRMVLTGKPSTAIAEYAKEKQIDLIVVGCSGAGLAEFLIGSTANSVCHQAPCPVLVVR